MEKYNTELCQVDYNLIKKNDIEELSKHPAIKKAADLLKQGQLVAFPTETVYGLGADATNEKAVEKIYQAKGRPQDNPLIVHIASFQQLENIVRGKSSNLVRKLIDNFWPGPLTIIFDKTEMIPMRTTAGLDSVAVRMPSHPLTRALIEVSGLAIAAPSANRSGKPSPTRASHVLNDLQGEIPLVLDGGSAWVGLESTIIDIRDDILKILRPGGISRERIQTILSCNKNLKISNNKDNTIKKTSIENYKNGDIQSGKNLNNDIKKGKGLDYDTERPLAPGMKYRHYSPETPLFIVENEQALKRLIDKGIANDIGIVLSDESYTKYRSRLKGVKTIKMGPRNKADIIATRLFDLLRGLDSLSLKSVYIEAIPQEGIGEAVMNRLYKASSRE